MQPGQRLDRVDLVGEAPDVRAVPLLRPADLMREDDAAGAEQALPGGRQMRLHVDRRRAATSAVTTQAAATTSIASAAWPDSSRRSSSASRSMRVRQLAVAGLGGGQADQGDIAAVAHPVKPLGQPPDQIVTVLPDQDRALRLVRQVR